MPRTCAYRLLWEGKPLFDWHPLISGDAGRASMPRAFRCSTARSREFEIDEDDWEDHIIEEPT